MSQSPQREVGSQAYSEAWRAINLLIRSGGTWSGRERNLCYRNRGDGSFEDISYVSGLDLDTDGRAFVPLDLDSDGDLDLIVKNRNGSQLRAFRNDLSQNAVRPLTVRLEGRVSNRDGVGAGVQVTTDRRSMVREIVSGSGYLSQRSRIATFGLMDGEVVKRLQIRWPLGEIQEFEGPLPGLDLTVTEGQGTVREAQRAVPVRGTSEPSGAVSEAAGVGTWLEVPVPAPDFRLPRVTRDGTQDSYIRLSELRGNSLVLNLWATWCPPCRRELADFSSRAGDFANAGIEILAVSLDEEPALGAVRALVDELKLEFPVLLADKQTAEAYSVLNDHLFDRRRDLAIPTTLLLDERGRIVKVYRGETDAAALLSDAVTGRGPALPFEGTWVLSQPSRRFEDIAAALAERGLRPPARQMFEEALARGTRTSALLNNFAGVLIADGDRRRAEDLLVESLATDPASADATINLATLLIERGDTSEAELLLRRALLSHPDDSQALSLLGSLWFSGGRLIDAQEMFQRAARTDPEDPRVHENLGAVLASRNRFAEAAREYESARNLGADSVGIHVNLGVLYMQLERPDKALASFRAAVRADPEALDAHLNLARYFLHSGDTGRASQSIQRALELAPGDADALALKAQILAVE